MRSRSVTLRPCPLLCLVNAGLSRAACRRAVEPQRIVNVHRAKTHLSRLIDDAHAGETILLAKAGKP